MSFEKKKAAALAAVMNYLKHEEEAAAVQMQAAMMAMPSYPAPEPAPPVSFNTWGTSGRSAQMQMRNIMQLKGFHGARIR